MISTWCAEDRKAMKTSAKRGGDVPAADCDSPVEEQYQLGREVGVNGVTRRWCSTMAPSLGARPAVAPTPAGTTGEDAQPQQ